MSLTNPALKRVMRRAGVERVNNSVFQVLNTHVDELVSDIMYDCLVFMRNSSRKTILLQDLYNVMQIRGTPLAISYVSTSKSFNLVKNFDSSRSVKKNASREVKQAQKTPGLVIPRKNFVDLIRSKTHHDDIKGSDKVHLKTDFYNVFQLYLENSLVSLTQRAMIVSQSKTLTSKDVETVLRL